MPLLPIKTKISYTIACRPQLFSSRIRRTLIKIHQLQRLTSTTVLISHQIDFRINKYVFCLVGQHNLFKLSVKQIFLFQKTREIHPWNGNVVIINWKWSMIEINNYFAGFLQQMGEKLHIRNWHSQLSPPNLVQYVTHTHHVYYDQSIHFIDRLMSSKCKEHSHLRKKLKFELFHVTLF